MRKYLKFLMLLLSCSIQAALFAQTEIPQLIEPINNADSSCVRYGQYNADKKKYFMNHVYKPSLKNTKLSAGNKALLNAIKNYLECEGTAACVDMLPVLPVFRMMHKGGIEKVSIFTHFFYDEASFDNNFNDTVLHHGLMQLNMRLTYSSDSKTAPCKIRKYNSFSSACDYERTFELYQPDTSDKRIPAFCTPYNLDLVFKSDPKADSLLSIYNDCNMNVQSYCDPATPQVTFAQLRHVPYLYFTTDIYEESGVSYPSRGIYLRLNDETLVELWRFKIEMVECSCI